MVNKQADRSPERARQDYCKTIFQLGGGRPARAADVARALSVSRASVTQIVRDLQRDGYLAPTSGRRLCLSDKGRRLALAILRRHRLIETFLHDVLGVPLEQLHAEAERIEHAVSNDVARRLEKFLRYPTIDPHGDPIPAGGRVRVASEAPLDQARVGDTVRIARIVDRDAAVVRALARAGMLPGVTVTVRRSSAAGMFVRRGSRGVRLPARMAAALKTGAVPRRQSPRKQR